MARIVSTLLVKRILGSRERQLPRQTRGIGPTPPLSRPVKATADTAVASTRQVTRLGQVEIKGILVITVVELSPLAGQEPGETA